MTRYLPLFFLMITPLLVLSQKYKSSESNVQFFSEAPLENIEAVNTESISLLDVGTKEIVFSIPITSFEFEKSLMQEHFNENYLESEKYPKSTLKAKIENWEEGEGVQTVKATGELTIHGVTKEVTIDGTIEKKGDSYEVNSKFPVKLKDYKIKIPKAVFYNIAEEVEVSVNFKYAPFSND